MSIGPTLSVMDVSASGLAAERLRMEVVANNIANAHSTRTAAGGPYRRQHVVFAAAFNDALEGPAGDPDALGGVRVLGVEPEGGELPRIYQPGHPHAGPDGYVTMPNVKVPNEMVDLITASRAYEANLRVLRLFREMAESALSLLRGP